MDNAKMSDVRDPHSLSVSARGFREPGNFRWAGLLCYAMLCYVSFLKLIELRNTCYIPISALSQKSLLYLISKRAMPGLGLYCGVGKPSNTLSL